MDKTAKTFPLATISPGQPVTIVSINLNGNIALRLAEMGLTPTTQLRVLRAQPGQPMLIAARDCRLAIDRSLAKHIIVQPLTDIPCAHPRGRRGFGLGKSRRRKGHGRHR